MTPFTDIWSLGVILYKVIYRHHPLYRVSKTHLDKNSEEFYNNRYQIPYPESPKFKSIIPILERMLVCSSNK